MTARGPFQPRTLGLAMNQKPMISSSPFSYRATSLITGVIICASWIANDRQTQREAPKYPLLCRPLTDTTCGHRNDVATPAIGLLENRLTGILLFAKAFQSMEAKYGCFLASSVPPAKFPSLCEGSA